MFSKKQRIDKYKHVLVFTKPKYSRDKGIIRLCRNDPDKRFKLKTIESVDHYINTEQYEYEHERKHKTFHRIIPIMYLSEWKISTEKSKKLFAQSLCRGFPRLQIISHKGNLAKLLNKYYAIHSADKLRENELFYPQTWVLPNENDKFLKETMMEEDESIKFIIKPQGKSKGNGISLVSQKSDINFEEVVVIQKYIPNPLLINNHKFDLRLYVMIASINPLQLYIYERGLVRFASVQYSQEMDLCRHLTNFTLNKKNLHKKTEIKWSLQNFWEHLKENGIDKQEMILSQIDSIITNVFQIAYNKLNEGFGYSFSNEHKNHGRCFDILGMDVLIDTDYKCWLMEFNRYPSLRCEHKIDKDIKYDLCNDLFTILKPRIICNHTNNIMYHHKMPIILSTTDTKWKRVL